MAAVPMPPEIEGNSVSANHAPLGGFGCESWYAGWKAADDPSASSRTKALPWKGSKIGKLQQRATDSFIRKLPNPSGWRQRQLDLGFDSKEQYENNITSLIRNNTGIATKSDDPLLKTGLMLDFAATLSIENRELRKALSDFQLLVQLFNCLALEHIGASACLIDEVLQLATQIMPQERRRLLESAHRIKDFYCRLIDSGWPFYRVNELFLLYSFGPSRLIVTNAEGLEIIFQHLTQDEFLKFKFEDCLAPEFSFAGLIEEMAKRAGASHRLTMQQVCIAHGIDIRLVANSRLFTVEPALSAAKLCPRIKSEFLVLSQESFAQSQGKKSRRKSSSPLFGRSESSLEDTLSQSTKPPTRFGALPNLLLTSGRFPRSQNIDWIQPTTESQQSSSLNYVNYEVFEQPVEPNRSYKIQLDTDQSDQGMSTRRQRQQQGEESEELIPYFTQDNNELHSPSPPQALLVAENLLYNVKVYFESSCRSMILDDHGTLLNRNGAELHNDLCNDFDSYCFTATMFAGKELHEEFGHALSRASALVKQILQAEHPRTLACFLEVFIHLIQTGLSDVAYFLCDFIKRMSTAVTKEGHPWAQICRLLGELDSESLGQAMAQIWECTCDTFERELGTIARLAVSVRLDYIKRVYGFKNCIEEERLLRDYLAQFNDTPGIPTPRVMLNLAHNLNRQRRYDEAEEMAQRVLSLLLKHEIYAERISERIECKKIVSHSRFNQGKALAAEQTMREAIGMIVYQWGREHSWALEFMNVLEGWLRGWGRQEDANTLQREIKELMRIGEAET